MGVYNRVEKAFNDMVYSLLDSEDLCKLLYYDNSDPLSNPPVENANKMVYIGGDIQETNDHRIFLMPKIPTITDNKKTIIIPRIMKIKPAGTGVKKNVYYKEFSVIFDVITHTSLWITKDGHIRVLQIIDLIDDIYNLKYSERSISNPYPLETPYIYPCEQWCGYRLEYRFTDWSGDQIAN